MMRNAGNFSTMYPASAFVFVALIVSFLPAPLAFGGNPPPSKAFDLASWKLQIPGPKEVKDLREYSSDYFYLNDEHNMCFKLNAAEKGPTQNTKYVRSELRHLLDWKLEDKHAIEGEFRVISHLTPDKVTALQIHGITEQGENAPPFLRIAINHGDLYAILKSANAGDKTESDLLKRGVGSSFVKVGVQITGGQLIVTVDGQEKLKKDVTYWKFSNYFKAGCYPQATEGTVLVEFRKLKVE